LRQGLLHAVEDFVSIKGLGDEVDRAPHQGDQREPGRRGLAHADRATNAGRHRARTAIQAEIAAITRLHATAELARKLADATIAHAAINDIRTVRDLPALANHLTTTRTPDGRTVRMQPAAVDREDSPREFAFAPKYGEHTHTVLREAGLGAREIDALVEAGVIPSRVAAAALQ
jgi:crotonobetainyl-CoA:carnitine CoA-transferase CaiB-like acyl-CoA transferase